MDRQIVYVGAIPLDTDQLFQARNTMTALGYLAKMVVGDGAAHADGLSCLPGAGLSVIIGPGSMTLPTVIDAQPYGALPPDNDPLVKAGINTGPTVLPVPAVGQVVVSGTVVELQAGSAAVSYYNAANPAQTLIGAAGNGQAQATVVQQRVALAATAADAVPAGYVPLWSVDVPAGSTFVEPSMIAPAPGAPFVTVKLPQAAPLLSPSFGGNPTAPMPAIGDASPSLATTGFVARATTSNRAAWGTGGTYGWTCPPGVSTVLMRAWAAGGRGGDAASGYPGGGGGGGSYEEALIEVLPGKAYVIRIGSGTSGSATTSFDTLVVLGGGANGQAGHGGGAGAGGGQGVPVTSAVNAVASLGVGAGQPGCQLGGNNLGGSGGPSFGVQGGATTYISAAAAPGVWPGGGGAGGAGGTGAAGADGLMILEWLG